MSSRTFSWGARSFLALVAMSLSYGGPIANCFSNSSCGNCERKCFKPRSIDDDDNFDDDEGDDNDGDDDEENDKNDVATTTTPKKRKTVQNLKLQSEHGQKTVEVWRTELDQKKGSKLKFLMNLSTYGVAVNKNFE